MGLRTAPHPPSTLAEFVWRTVFSSWIQLCYAHESLTRTGRKILKKMPPRGLRGGPKFCFTPISGPRSQVCARLTLRLPPIDTSGIFSAHVSKGERVSKCSLINSFSCNWTVLMEAPHTQTGLSRATLEISSNFPQRSQVTIHKVVADIFHF